MTYVQNAKGLQTKKTQYVNMSNYKFWSVILQKYQFETAENNINNLV